MLVELEGGLQRVQATGSRLGESFMHAMWADALRRCGQPERALAVLDQALATAREVRCPPSTSPRSPKKSPAPTRATTRCCSGVSRTSSTSPDWITYK